MNKSLISASLIEIYSSFLDDINKLTTEEYLFRNEEKWSAGQQLEHLVLCVKPLVQVFSMDRQMIRQNFGVAVRPCRSYEKLLEDYTIKLLDGGKAPSKFVSENALPEQRAIHVESLLKQVNALCIKIETFSDQELDSLLIPHPLLGNLTLREMLYNAIYHARHHQKQMQENLKKNYLHMNSKK